MTKEEFQAIAEVKVSTQNFDKIHEVYNFHPSISFDPPEAKRNIAEIYKIGGMTLIKDMLPRAKRVAKAESNLNTLRAKIQEAEYELREAKLD